MIKRILILLFLGISPTLFAAPAKVILLRGKAISTYENASPINLTKGALVKEGSVVETDKGSVVKIIFIDKSVVTVGPNSKMEIQKFKKGEAGMLSLIKGKVRSQVAKDLLNKNQNTKSKLFIKTETAAMGVRGTDFTVGFNPKTGGTSLDVISGRVAMVNIAEFRGIKLDQRGMDSLLQSNKSVIVNQGFRTQIPTPKDPPLIPTEIPQAEIEIFKQQDTFVGDLVVVSPLGPDTNNDGAPDPNDDAPKEEGTVTDQPPPPPLKPEGEILPPGVPKDAFVNESPELMENIDGTLPPPPPPPEGTTSYTDSYTVFDPNKPPPPPEDFALLDPNLEKIIEDTTADIEGEITDNFDQNSGFTKTRVIFKFN